MRALLGPRGAVFLGALLLFLVQPMVGRALLPLLGGSAQVWTTCMLFFQVTLLAAYGWAHLTARRLPAGVHLGMVAAALGWVVLAGRFPLGAGRPEALGLPPGEAPLGWLLRVLLLGVGPAFFAVAVTTPLVQAWVAGGEGADAADPYPLFSASNLGSAAALVLYPLVVDRYADLQTQRALWTGGLALFLVVLSTAWLQRHQPLGADDLETVDLPAAAPSSGPAQWVVLAFVPSSLLLGVTAHMTEEVPSSPLLWTLPLLLYLASFVRAFARDAETPPRWAVAVHQGLLCVLALVLFVPMRVSGFTLHLTAFLVSALVLHGELARLRPASEDLTRYYLWVAFGGALGGLWNGVAAPALFPFLAEYPLAVLAAAALHPPSPGEGGGPRTSSGRERLLDLAAPALLLVVLVTATRALPRVGDARDVAGPMGVLLVGAAVTFWFRPRRRRFALGIAALLVGGFLAFRAPGVVWMGRSFYGAHRVVATHGGRRHLLFHGSTLHGAQDRSGPTTTTPPLSYFHPESAVAGLMREALPPRARVAVVGLGVGALAWYLEPGQRLRYLEIDPVVAAVARDPAFFTFLRDSAGEVEVQIVDGRLGLERERGPGHDLLALDAFSSDAVPQHLVTREALEVYRARLRPGGALLFNVSNRHVRLEALVARLARDAGMPARIADPPPLTPADRRAGYARARWVALAEDASALARWAPAARGWRDLEADAALPVWTDAHASLLPYLRW